MNIEFLEDTESGYEHRTYENVRLADITIAFAKVPDSPGEVMTREAAKLYNKPFIMVDLSSDNIIMERFDPCNVANIHSINVAGNGMSRFVHFHVTQEMIDQIVYNYIRNFIIIHKLDIKEIRSGGQTGADESGLKAAIKLGIKAICLCPKGWRLRTETTDISNETIFKNRFKL